MFQWVTSKAWDETIKWLFGAVVDALSQLFQYINGMGVELFSLKWVNSLVTLFIYLGWALFVVGLCVTVFDTAIEAQQGRANIHGSAVNVLKGFFAVNLFSIVPVQLYLFCVDLQGSFSRSLASYFYKGDADISALARQALRLDAFRTASVFAVVLLLVIGYCIIKVCLANIKRGGILLIMICTGSLHMFSVPRGYMDGFLQWCKQVVALCMTAFLQSTILMLGLITLITQTNPILGVGLMLSATEVERIAGMFGLDTSMKGNVMSAVYATQSVVNTAKSVVTKIK